MQHIILTDIMGKDNRNAGSKARNDARDILTGMGYKAVTVFDRNLPGYLRALQGICSLLSLFIRASRGSTIVLQYPYNIGLLQIFISILTAVRKIKGAKIVLLIHDIYYLRGDQDYPKAQMLEMERNILNKADILIVHNKKMQQQLKQDGINVSMIVLELFDYLDTTHSTQPEETYAGGNTGLTIAFAGALDKAKSGFLQDWKVPEAVKVILYGKGGEGLPDDYDYRGIVRPEELTGLLKADYGLVWDGSSMEKCDGNYGEYLRYNNPHKASLYIAAGLPLLVWKEAVIADFVIKNNIGQSIASLSDIENVPKADSAEYQSMKAAVRELSQKVRRGEFLEKAFREI